MKIANNILLGIGVIAMLASCGHKVSNETVVNEDGSTHKTFLIYQHDSKKAESEKMIGISETSGWIKNELQVDTSSSGDGEAYQVKYSKAFVSVNEMNAELGRLTDTTLQVTATFEKKFRWFYTYIHYTETYHPINKMRLPSAAYVTREDSAFIERLPPEGEKISPADSIHLATLNDKWFEQYGTAAFADEYFSIAVDLMRSQNIPKEWEDRLASEKALLHEVVNFNDHINVHPDSILTLMRRLHIPLDYDIAHRELSSKQKALESKIAFMAWAVDGTFQHVITMPWEVIDTNADSVVFNRLLFHPPVTKFLFRNHTLYATCRKLNYWTIAITIALVAFTILLFLRDRKRNPSR